MSKQVDERVVSMQFDNKNFEKNVSTSMSTLDKLKAKLNFDGASKGLDNINAAVQKVDMGKLSSGIEEVRIRFSKLEVMGVTALANITNSAVNAGKRMVSALTIDPVKTGFQEYETQLNAVQTILANTKSKGSTLNDVNKALDTLNTYADQTIYNFTEMTRNIGTFTAAGVDLQTSVDSIKGIANLAAVSGSTSAQASTAMYQLSQALAAGKVSLQDWNSVVNAGMGGEVFQNALIRTSELLKTGAKQAIKTEGSFRESLTKSGWLTKEVLTETLKQLSGAYTEADLINKGFTKEQAKEIVDLAETAKGAATDVKTFTQLWDVMKEAAQSGWAKTWQLIIGDFEGAKKLLTPLADFFSNMIGKMSDARNNLLEGALGKRFTKLAKTISGVTAPIKGAADAVKDFGDIVNRVIVGEFGNGEDRLNKLTKAGYNYYAVQNKVNETLNNGFRYSNDVIESQDKLLSNQNGLAKSQSDLNKSTENSIEKLVEMSDAQLKSAGYTDEQIQALRDLKTEADKLGMPLQEFIDKMDDLNGRSLIITSFKNIFNGLSAILKTVAKAWKNVFPPKSLEERQEGVYNLIAALHKFSTKFKELAEEADKKGTTINKLRRTLEGLFTILKIIKTILGGPLKIALKLVSKVLGLFNLDILDVTAAVGDAIVGFDKWLQSTLDFNKVFKWLVDIVKKSYDGIRNWIDTIKASENAPKAIADGITNGFGKAVEFVATMFKQLASNIQNGFNGIPDNVISGFVNGVWNGIKSVGQVMVELGKNILEAFRGVLGIHSPSTETYSDGMNFMIGFKNGLTDFASMVWDFIKTFGQKCIDILKDIKFSDVITGILTVSSAIFMKKLGKTSDSITEMFEGVSGILGGTAKILDKSAKPIAKILKNTAKVVKSFSKVMNGVAFDLKAEGIKKLATSVAILVGCIVVLTFFDPEKLWNAVKVVAALSAILLGLAAATEKMSKSSIVIGKNGAKINDTASTLKGIAAALLMVALTLKIIGSMSWEALGKAVIGISVFAVLIAGLMAATKLAGRRISRVGDCILKIGEAMLLMAVVCKLLGRMSWENLIKGIIGTAFLGLIIVGLIAATKLAGSGRKLKQTGDVILEISKAMLLMAVVAKIIAGISYEDFPKVLIGITFLGAIITGLIAATKLAGNKLGKIGNVLIQISTAMLLMAVVCKIIASISYEDFPKVIGGITFLGLIITGLIAATKLAGNKLDKVGEAIVGVGAAMLLMAVVCKIIASMKVGEMIKAGIGIAFLALIIEGLISSTKLAGNKLDNVGKTIILVAAAIGILAGVAFLLGLVPIKNLAKGIIAVGLLAKIMSELIKATDKAKHAKATMAILGTLSACMIIMAGIIYLLSRLPVESVIGSAGALSLLMAVMTGVLTQMSKIGKDAKNALKGVLVLTAMAVPLMFFVGVLAAMQSVQNGIKSVISLSILAGVMTGLISQLAKIGDQAKNALKAVLVLTAMTLPLLGFTLVLSLMSGVENAIINAIALSLLTAAMVSMLKPLTNIKSGDIDNAVVAITMLAAMTIPLLGFTLVLSLMSGVENAITNAIALSLLTGAMVTMLKPLLEIKPGDIDNALIGIGSLTAMLIPLAGCALILSLMSGVENAIVNAAALATLLVSMAEVTLILSKVGNNAIAAVKAAAAFDGVIAIITALMLGLGAIFQIPGVDTLMNGGIEMLAMIGEGIGKFIGSIVAGFAEELMSTLPYLGTCLSEFITNATPFITGVKMVDESVLAGAGILAAAILALSVADLIAGITSLLPFCPSLADMGVQLSAFMLNALPFITIAKTIDPSAATGIKALADTILELTAANLLDGITRFLTGGSSIASFGAELIPLGEGLKGFSDAVEGIDNDRVKTAAEAAKTLAEMTDTIPNSGGMVSWFTGDNSISQFGDEIVKLGEGLKGFSDAVEDISPENVKAAAEAGKALADMTGKIPNSGGVVSWFTGDNSISQFADEIPKLGSGLKGFSDEVKDIKPEKVKAAAEAAKSIAEMTSAIPNSNGVVAWFTGDNSISQFADEIPKLGSGLKGFSDEVKDIKPEKVKAAAEAAKSIAEMTDSIPKEGGVKGWFEGDSSISKFGTELGDLGKGLNNFSKNIKDVESEKVTAAANAAKSIAEMTQLVPKEGGLKGWFEGESSLSKFSTELGNLGTGLYNFASKFGDTSPDTITAGANAAKTLAEMANSTPADTSNITNFGTNLETFGTNLFKFFDNFAWISATVIDNAESSIKDIMKLSDIDYTKLGNVANAIGRMVEVINDASTIEKDATTGFKSAVETLAKTNIDNFIRTFNDASPDIKKSASNLMDSFIEGTYAKKEDIIKGGKETVSNFTSGVQNGDENKKATNAFTNLITACSKVISDKHSDFYNAGADLVTGFANGISAHSFEAEAKASAMAQAALTAAKKELDEHSPSKKFYKIGAFAGEGFINALGDYKTKSYKSASSIAESAKLGLSRAIGKIKTIIDNGIDSQPTIRPVLDLTDISSGTNSINDMLSLTPSIGVMSNVSSISSMMNNRKAGVNDDVISAIEDLGRKIGNTSGNTYTINGITYDDGSDISDAIKSLVRAARIERRI